MAFNVSLSQGVLSNLLALSNTTDQINTVQNRLATGKKVNSALDNPTNFFLAVSFQNSVNTLSVILDNITIGQRTIEAANNGITTLTDLISSAQGSLNQALASAPTTAVVTGTATSLTSTTTLVSLGFAAGNNITVSDGANGTTFTVAATSTISSLLTAINAGTQGIRAELSGDGRVLLEATTATATITISSNAAASTAQLNLGFNSQATNGTLNSSAAAGTLNSTR